MATTSAGRPRRLSDELDRMDRVLDVLGDGLSEAVADAVRAGARAAVLEALAEFGLRALTERATSVPAARDGQSGRCIACGSR